MLLTAVIAVILVETMHCNVNVSGFERIP